jgi:hypothetical protein
VNLWINAILYQLTWLAAVGGAGRGWWWAGPAMALAFAAWQLGTSRTRRADFLLVLFAAALGLAVDSLFVQGGLLRYAAAAPWSHLAPAWILSLWAAFALTLNHSLAYLKTHLPAAAVLGGIGAPLAYWAAASGFGALTFPADPARSLVTLTVVWAVLAPALSLTARYLSAQERESVALHGGAR